jgi:hypothetical protein
MTISSTTRIAGPFIGNGTASAFPFTFKVFAATDLDVIKLTVSTGTESTLVLTTDYTVTLNGDQNSNPGGTVTLTAGALASGFTLTITSDIANLQPTDLTNQGGFYPEVITDSLDRATIQIQQIADIGDRTLKIPISDGTLNMELPTKTERANSFLSFDANGLPSVVTAGSSGAPATITRQVFSGTGSQTVFTLASDPGALGNSAQVYIGGVYQQRSTYTIAGTTLTFSQAPVAGTDNIEFVNFLTSNIGAISADLVTYTPSGTGAVARSAASKMGDVVSVKDFGAVGDNIADDTVALQAAMTFAENNNVELRVPAGVYRTTAPLVWSKSLRMIGAPRNGTNSTTPGTASVCIRAVATMQAVILGPTSTSSSGLTFSSCFDGINIECSTVADYGIYGMTYASTFSNMRVSNSKIAAFRVGTITNIFTNLLIQYGTGDGIVVEHASSFGANHTTIRNVQCILLSGFGIVVNGPTFTSSSNGVYGVTIESCLMEDCRKGGIFLTSGVSGFKIDRCYFEGNAADGYTFTTGVSHLVKSDIIINGFDATQMGRDRPCSGGSITNCITSTNGTSFVFAAGIDNSVIEANAGRAPVTTALPVVEFYGTASAASSWNYGYPTNLRLGANAGFSNAIAVDPFGTTAINIPGEGTISQRFAASTVFGASQVNIASHDLNTWSVITGSTGSFVRSSVEFPFDPLVPVWEVQYAAGLTTTSVFGFQIDASKYPLLHGKPMLFSVWAKAPFVTTTANGYVNLRCNGADTDSSFRNWNSFGWVRKMGFFIMPTSGTISFGIQASAAGAASNTPAVATPSGAVQVAAPVLCEYGADFEALWGAYGLQTSFNGTAAPTTGTWKQGDIVVNTTPSAGGTPGWVCTTAGTPGTWKAMANVAP